MCPVCQYEVLSRAWHCSATFIPRDKDRAGRGARRESRSASSCVLQGSATLMQAGLQRAPHASALLCLCHTMCANDVCVGGVAMLRARLRALCRTCNHSKSSSETDALGRVRLGGPFGGRARRLPRGALRGAARREGLAGAGGADAIVRQGRRERALYRNISYPGQNEVVRSTVIEYSCPVN